MTDDQESENSSRRKAVTAGDIAEPPGDLLEAIGLLIITASAVDQQVGFQILRFLTPGNPIFLPAWPVVAGMEFRVKLTLLRILAASYGKDVSTRITECCDELQTLYQQRNRLSHSPFSGLTRTGRAKFQNFNAETQTGFLPQPFVVSVNQIRDWAAYLFAWAEELERRLSGLGFPDKGPERARGAARRSEDAKGDNHRESRSGRTKRKKSSSPPQQPRGGDGSFRRPVG
jgi:hypothetical protein